MRIGIDIDNTITDTLPVFIRYCKKYNEEIVKRNIPMNETGFNITTLYDWTQEEKDDCFLKYIDEAREQVEVKPNAKKLFKNWKKKVIVYIL